MLYAFLFFFGLAAGSFLNVVSMRYLPERQTGQPGGRLITKDIIIGRSCCPQCSENLRWYELVPLVSFIVQKGHCRSCGARLSFQYPIVELLSGLIFTAVPFSFLSASVNVQSALVSALWILVFLTL